MKYRIVLSIGIAVFIGLILIPSAIFYFPNMAPYMIAAAIIAGVISFLISGNQNALKDELALMNTENHKFSAQMTELLTSIANAVYPVTSAISNLENKLAELANDIKMDNREALSSACSNASSVLRQTLEQLSVKLQETNKTMLSELTKSLGIAVNDMSQSYKGETTALKDSILNSQNRLYSLLAENRDNLNKFSSNISDSNKSILASLSNFDSNNQNLTSSFSSLANDIRSYTTRHTEIQQSLSMTAKDIQSFQSKLKDVVNSQESVIADTVSKLANNMQAASRKTADSMQNNYNDFVDKVDEIFKDFKEQLEEFTFSVDSSTENVTNTFNSLQDTLSSLADNTTELTQSVIQLKKLSASEENMMKELDKICRNNPKQR